MPRLIAIALALCTWAACSSRSKSRCDAVCAREAECAEETRQEFDRAECVEVCLGLERNERGRSIVDRHAGCVLQAEGCPAVLQCE